MSDRQKLTTVPSASDIQNTIELCIATTWQKVYNAELLGKNIEPERALLKRLNIAYSLNIWEDIEERFDELYAQIPQCLNCNS